MIIVKFLGIIDILAGVLFWVFSFWQILPQNLMFIIALLLLIKGVSFLIAHDIASIGDVICSVIIFFSLHSPVYSFIAIITSIYLIQKGVFSLL